MSTSRQPRPDSVGSLNRRQNGSGWTKATCLVCGARYAKYRTWQSFCSSKCRKQAWIISHRTGTYTDIRSDIAAIKADVAAIMKIISDVWSAAIKAKTERWDAAIKGLDNSAPTVEAAMGTKKGEA